MPKKQPKKAFSIQSYDNAHYRSTDAYAAIVQRLFDRCTDIIAAASVNIDPSKPFSFADYPQVRAVMVKATNQLADNMTSTIETGTRQQWVFANKKCDAFLASIMDTSKLTKSQLEAMQTRSTIGLAAFQNRKVGKDGLNLSQRVWRYVNQYREQIEHALDVGLGEGRDYRQLARDLKANLREPNRLFRRVRDKHGNLQLSKNAAAYHPGPGVYRSSVKNAQRLARSEINMAYREADWQRWQSLDFVIGYEVVRSNWRDDKGREYKCKLCERLKGRYPKTFKFVGWHPQCRCHAIPIMADYFSEDASKDRIARMRAALYGTEYKKYVPKETITDLPDGFKEWMEENMEASQDWASTPYFIRDNFKQGNMKNGLLREPRPIDVDAIEQPQMKLSALPNDQRKAIRSRIENLELGSDLEAACANYGISTDHWAVMAAKAYDDPENNWRLVDDCDAEKQRLEGECDRRAAMDKDMAQKIIDELQSAILELKKWDDEYANDIAKFWKKYCDRFSQQKAKRWGEYGAIIGSCQRQIDGANKGIADMKANWDVVKKDMQLVVDAASDKSTVAKLSSLANETPRIGRDAKTIIKEIKSELMNLKGATDKLQTQVEDLKKTKIDKKDVGDLAKTLTDDEIVARLGGGDLTTGSCASLSLAYIGNKHGLDVIDYRGGESQKFFSKTRWLVQMMEAVGGVTTIKKTAAQLRTWAVGNMVAGKLYALRAGCHMAIVRLDAKGKMEYLELQSSTKNGFLPMTTGRDFQSRFGGMSRGGAYGTIVEISRLGNDVNLRDILAYLNTNESEQKKGSAGTIK